MDEFNELYDQDQYLKEFDAAVVSCVFADPYYEIVLDRTAFYPEGGGQPADQGELNGVKVKDVQKKNGRIIHYCSASLEAGSEVHGVIDWQRRFDHMQNHSGEHIVSGLIHRHFGYDNVGFHMGEMIQIDFNGFLDSEQIAMIETEANRIIQSDIPVQSVFPDAEQLKTMDYRSKKELSGKVRIVIVEGADVCACCGTHVARTGEIGLVKILSAQKHKNGIRMEMLAGMRAFAYIQKAMQENHEVSVILSAPELKTSSALKDLNQSIAEKDVRIRQLGEKLLMARLDAFEEGQPLAVDFVDEIDRNVLRRYGNSLLNRADTAAVLCGEEDHWNYFILSRSRDLKACVKDLNQKLNGRGGGSREMIQGSFQSPKEKIEAVLREALG